MPRGCGQQCKTITASLYFYIHADSLWNEHTPGFSMKIQTIHFCNSMCLCVSLHQNTVVTTENERQHLRDEEWTECTYLIVLLKSNLYSYQAKFSTSVNVLISEHLKPAENMTHPPDVPVRSNVPFTETNLQDGKEQSSSTSVSTVVSLKPISTLQHSTSFCRVTPGVHQNRTLYQDLCLKNSSKTKSQS